MKYHQKVIKTTNYPIYIGDNIYKEFNSYLNHSKFKDSNIFIIVDENTKTFCLPSLQENVEKIKNAEIIQIKSGEENKSLRTAELLWAELLKRGAYRSSLILNLGGGVICDMGGFISSTFQRGIPYINIPTTLLAQVDASIGGKTAIDFYDAKNQIGLFSDPDAVFINPDFLSTLPYRQIFSGFAEIIKHALIKDANYWKMLKPLKVLEISDWSGLIFHSIVIKNSIVKLDPLDNNQRKRLNFGHNIGHAVESLSLKKGKDTLLHGEAVVVGMICESFLSHKKIGLPSAELNEITQILMEKFPPYSIVDTKKEDILQLLRFDKKNNPRVLNFTLIKKIGKALINKSCSAEDIKESIDFYCSLCNKNI
jgi:3-dehydroquinate synthase